VEIIVSISGTGITTITSTGGGGGGSGNDAGTTRDGLSGGSGSVVVQLILHLVLVVVAQLIKVLLEELRYLQDLVEEDQEVVLVQLVLCTK
jgi:hypothetical protein